MRNHRITSILIAVMLVAGTIYTTGSVPLTVSGDSSTNHVYVESSLYTAKEETLSVIVTAMDSESAARAVEHVGGSVTSDLWLINAVAATLPADQVETLAGFAGVQSIVGNNGVKTADDWSGWVTNIRIKRKSYTLEGNQSSPAIGLPDGGFVSISDNGKALIANADGSERARINLPGGNKYLTAPVVGTDGTI